MNKKRYFYIAVVLLFLSIGYGIFNYISKETFGNKSDSTALKISQLKEKVKIEDLSKYFNDTKGSFVLFDKNNNEYFIFDELQSQKRVSPCSTFKILNSLIGLETDVLKDENTVFEWDGKKNYIDEWNKDHTLTSAFRNSVVWYYQEVASRVGKESMQSFLDEVSYGNSNITGGLTKFWPDSSLKISPLEQVEFLRDFHSYELPFSRENIDIVKKIMIVSNENGVVLAGKTGSAGSHLGWFVGYVEKEDNIYFFATKIEGNNVSGSIARKIAQDILKYKNLL